MWTIILIVYLIGYVFSFRRITGQYAWHLRASKTLCSYQTRALVPNGEQWFAAILVGLLCAITWPLSLPISHGISSSHSGNGFFYIPPKEKERIQTERIKQLEKAAGIR